MMTQQHLLVGTQRGIYFLPVEVADPLVSPAAFALHGLEVDPVGRDAADPAILYASAGQDGLWRSTDRGIHWTKVWEAPVGSELYTFLAHPALSGILYAGLEPASVWTSTDGGRSWNELEALQAVPDKAEWHFFPPRHAHVRALTIQAGGKAGSDTLYVGIEEGGVYVGENGGSVFQSRNAGLYRDIHQIGLFRDDRNLLLATTGGGLYRSEDDGLRWTHITQGLTRSYTVPLLIGSDPARTIFVAAAAAPPPSWNRPKGGADAKIFRSRDRGLTWQETSAGLPSPQTGMIYCLLAHPADPARLFAGTTDGKVYTSLDQGDHWRLVASGLPEVYSLCWVP
ncbi:MAG: hypothetical protein HY581_11645 [Nitrospirae bacterium]|nr:hypothetical protein [Nitrospirota bacterium]